MLLDSFTLLVASCAAMVLLGLSLLYFWNLDRRSKWLLWWSVPFLIGSSAVFFYLRPSWEGDFNTIGFGNAVRIVSVCLLWQGARVFEGRRPILLALVLAPLAWLGLCLIPPFFSTMAARIVGASLFNFAFCGLAAYELWRGRGEVLVSRMPAAVVLLSFSLFNLLRVATVNVLPFPVGALPLEPVWMGIFNLIVFVHATFLGFLLIAMTKERHEAEQRTFASLDPLTGLMNRRAFMNQVERSARRRKFGREPLALMVLDLDRFKSINDRFGHEVGDRVLVAFATITETCLRPTDQLYRMGGEEFCFILPDTALPDAIAVAERVRIAVAGNSVKVGSESVLATVGIGVAVTDHAGLDLEVLLGAADAAVYEAKARGRDRVVIADPVALQQASPNPEPDFVERRKRA